MAKKKAICSIGDCGSDVYGHGLCSKHYTRNLRHGDPLFTTRRSPIFDLQERLRKRVLKTDSCWLWQGSQDGKGYGITRIKGRNIYVHRIMYELTIGPIPADKELDHLCRVPLCCNPDHLEPVPHRINLLRGTGASATNAIKTHCPKGHPYITGNVYIDKRGARICRTCRIEASRNARRNR